MAPPRRSAWGNRGSSSSSGAATTPPAATPLSDAAFPDLASTRNVGNTRRARAAAASHAATFATDSPRTFNPYPSRVEEINSRVTAWHSAGRSSRSAADVQDDNLGLAVPALGEENGTIPDEDEVRSSVSSIVVRDMTQRNPKMGAWASMAQAGASDSRPTGPFGLPPSAWTNGRRLGSASETRSASPLRDVQRSTPHYALDHEALNAPDVPLLQLVRQCHRDMMAVAAERHAGRGRPEGAFPPFEPLLAAVSQRVASPLLLAQLAKDAGGSGIELLNALLSGDELVALPLPDAVRDALAVRTSAACDALLETIEVRAAECASMPEPTVLTGFVQPGVPEHRVELAELAHQLLQLDPVRMQRTRLVHLAEAVPYDVWLQLRERWADVRQCDSVRLERIVQDLAAATSARIAAHRADDMPARKRPDHAAPAPAYQTDAQLRRLLDLLAVAHAANEQRGAAQIGTPHFYAMASELLHLEDEYAEWVHADPRRADPTRLWLCDYAYVLSLGAKVQILTWEAHSARRHAAHVAWLGGVRPPGRCAKQAATEPDASEDSAGPSRTPTSPGASDAVLQVTVRREQLLDDSLACLLGWDDAHAFHKPLQVTFVGEQAQDAGGLRKEWLLLLCEALQADPQLLVDLGESQQEPEMRGVLWFPVWAENAAGSKAREPPEHSAALERLELLGILLGLALFHQITVPLRLPRALYALLLPGAAPAPPSLSLLRSLKPALAQGLDDLLHYDEAAHGRPVEDAMHLVWTQAVRAGSGRFSEVELVPRGRSTPVTVANRGAYVERVAAWTLCDSVEPQLGAVRRGFARVVAPAAAVRSPLSLLDASELQTLVCGREERELDVDALRATTTHVGFPAQGEALHSLDRFWAVWRSLQPDEQHALLGFVTGTPRMPALGAPAVGLRIQHVEAWPPGGAPRVPWSSTCTSTLFLPTYRDQAQLERQLRVALAHSRGFGLA